MRASLLTLLFIPSFLSAQTLSLTNTFVYDNLNRLTKTTYSNGNIDQYFYDQLGNRTQKVVVINCQLPSANLTGTATIGEGESTNLGITFSGNTPYTYTLNSDEYTLSSSSISYPVTPLTTTTYSISEISNACGFGIANGEAIVTVIPVVLLPDLIIQDAYATYYSDTEIGYWITIKNTGNQTADMSSFILGRFGSSDTTQDASDTNKGNVSLTGTTSLAPEESVSVYVTSPIDYAGSEHYILLLADYTSVVIESDDDNNGKVLLLKECTESGSEDLNLSGSQTENYFSGNKTVTIGANATFPPNTVITGNPVIGLPNTSLNQNNISILTGTCAEGESFSGNVSGNDSFRRRANTQESKPLTMIPYVKNGFVEVTVPEEEKVKVDYLNSRGEEIGSTQRVKLKVGKQQLEISSGEAKVMVISTTSHKYLIQIGRVKN